jgi:hypothetical protein
MINLMIVKMKLDRECKERNMTMNDLFILGILRTMRRMGTATKRQLRTIENRVRIRFLPSSKLYRIMRMTLDLKETKKNMKIKLRKYKKAKMRDKLRRKILFNKLANRIVSLRLQGGQGNQFTIDSLDRTYLSTLSTKLYAENINAVKEFRISKKNAE